MARKQYKIYDMQYDSWFSDEADQYQYQNGPLDVARSAAQGFSGSLSSRRFPETVS